MKEHRVKNKQQPKWLIPEIMDAMKPRDRYKALNNDHRRLKLGPKIIKNR